MTFLEIAIEIEGFTAADITLGRTDRQLIRRMILVHKFSGPSKHCTNR